MGLLSNKVWREKLNPGDHIYTWRRGYSYSHHGIYMGDGKVIHLTRAPGLIILSSSNVSSPSHSPADRVVCCSTEEFLSGGDLNLYEYGVNTAIFLIKRGGTCTRTTSDQPEDVLHRASILLERGFGDYNLFQNNCEDFAIYCKTGLLKVDMSKHGSSGQIQFLIATCFVFSFTPSQFLPSGFSSLSLVVYGFVYCLFRFGADGDIVEKVAVEKFDLRYRRSVRIENGSTRSSLYYYLAFTSWMFNYWSWTPASRILLWIRLVNLHAFLYSFASYHLRNHPMNLKLWEYVGWIIWVLGFWYWNSESRIYLWTNLYFLFSMLLLFVSDHSRSLKLQEYICQTALLLGAWDWTPERIILLWIRLLLLNIFLVNFVPLHLRSPFSKRLFVACLVIQSATLFLGFDYRNYIFRITMRV